MNLQILGLNNNQLTQLPSSFRKLNNLTLLYLHNNNDLSSIPDFIIGEMKNLETFYINKNKLEKLPDSVIDLPKLKILGVSM